MNSDDIVIDAFATNYAINLVIILALYEYNKLVFNTNKRLFKNILQLFSSINLLYNELRSHKIYHIRFY